MSDTLRDASNLRQGTEEVWERRRAALDDRRPASVAYQHKRGRLTARERLALLVDDGSFREVGVLVTARADITVAREWDVERLSGDAIVTGMARVDGRPVAVVSFDYTVMSGTLGQGTDARLERTLAVALERGFPLVLLVEGAGGRIHERMGAFVAGGHHRFFDLSLMSGWVPVVAGVVGPTYAGHANLIGLADYVVMEQSATLALAGHRLVEAATGEKAEPEKLGGASMHWAAGTVDDIVETEQDVMRRIREYLSYLPSNGRELPPRREHQSLDMSEAVMDVLPHDRQQPYDMKDLMRLVVDGGEFLELRAGSARTVVTALSRIDGYSVGVLANNPKHSGGMLDVAASDKMAHFISLCDAFNIPLLFLVDVPGYMVGLQQERQGIVRRAARPLVELAQATVPRMTVVVRKAYGLAYHAMGGTEFQPDLFVTWPTAEMSLMGAEAAAFIVGKGASDVAPEDLVRTFEQLAQPQRAAEAMRLDDIIDPRETRRRVAETLAAVHGQSRYRRAMPPRKHSISPT